MTRAVRVHPHGLELGGGDVLPLWIGTMHYWRHRPAEWGAGLDAMRSMGLRLVDTYVPWAVHEIEAGELDFGQRDPRLDVARFLEMAHERGLRAVLRPGPHINAELTLFGLPERVVWDRACQARTPRDNPVMLPMVPVAFPVPSYASEIFHEEVARWYAAVGRACARLCWPAGPIVMVQVDNEGALYFRDGPYDQDYHPDAVALFRSFLTEKYGSPKALREAWNEPGLSFATVTPPVRFDAHGVDDLARHMDWMEFHEHLLATGMTRMAKELAAAGFGSVPTMHNFPLGEAATPLNAARLPLDLIGLDYYHRATAGEHMTVLRRTSELASRCEGTGAPPYGAEVGAGFPPFFAPLDEHDSIYTLVAALAYGLRGFNLYMAVERDRWVGAPIDPHGARRPFADRYERLIAALDRVQFHTLVRRAPVRLVVPRSLRRLARATHAFGPMTPALFNVLGAGFRESCLEDDFGLGTAATIEGEAWLRAFERALAARGVPFAYAGGETFAPSTKGASWVLCATPGGIKADLLESFGAAAAAGVRVTIGPRAPDRDGSMRLAKSRFDAAAHGIEIEPLDDIARADALVARRIEELGLPTYPASPDDVHVAVHEDASGAPRVVFVMNPTAVEIAARVALPGVIALEDLLEGSRVARTAGGFDVTLPPRTARIFRAGP